ncbi:hypothetical protein BOTBODRAFT_140224, partial [Botryobasidium botryosum FD-172 SS1]
VVTATSTRDRSCPDLRRAFYRLPDLRSSFIGRLSLQPSTVLPKSPAVISCCVIAISYRVAFV